MTPTTQDAFRRGARQASLARLVKIRLYLVPVLVVIAGAVGFVDRAPWRRITLASIAVMMVAVSLVEWHRAQTHGPEAVNGPLNFGAMTVGLLALVCATGGVFSPAIMPLVLVRFISSMLLPRQRRLWIDAALCGAIFGVAALHPHLAMVPEAFGFSDSIAHGALPWVFAGLTALFILVASKFGRVFSDVLEDFFLEALHERDRRLGEYAEQNRALSALSAEIAHELKNPLSTIKGLASMVGKRLEGKDAERMGVLRREVDRLQQTLDDHLNFSRPLVPLGLEDVALRELVIDAVRLFEGVASEQGVTLEVAVPDMTVRCDPRKMRQVLINLVQNAIDASPNGKVSVRAEGDETIVLLVEDEGHGLDDALAKRVFEAGVTTKKQGSGIGLVVARALVRQHGGDLILRNRSTQGCEARISLPRVAQIQVPQPQVAGAA